MALNGNIMKSSMILGIDLLHLVMAQRAFGGLMSNISSNKMRSIYGTWSERGADGCISQGDPRLTQMNEGDTR